MQYDVFISYSRKDYVDEQEVIKDDSPVKVILEFLEAHNISYWFDKNGIYSGSEFVEVIANAIANSQMMLFISSKHSNESIYTAGEIFEAIENQRLIIPIKIDDSKYNKKFKLLLNPLDYIDYSKSDALSALLRTIETEKDRISKLEFEETLRREELKKREWRNAVKNEVLEQVNELKKLDETHQVLLGSIYKKLRSIDVVQKKCPVCGSTTQIDTEYCQTCGWFFPALTEIAGLGIATNKPKLILAQSLWESKRTLDTQAIGEEYVNLQKINKESEIQNTRLKNKVISLSHKLDLCERENAALKNDANQPSFKEKVKLFCISFLLGIVFCFVSLLIIGLSEENNSTIEDVTFSDALSLNGEKHIGSFPHQIPSVGYRMVGRVYNQVYYDV